MQSLLRMCGLKILTLKSEDGFQLGTNSNGSGILNRQNGTNPKNLKAIL
jgi:hypothetical protein